MSTELKPIEGTINEYGRSELYLTVYCGKEGRSLQLTSPSGQRYTSLGLTGMIELRKSLDAVIEGTYKDLEYFD